MRDMAYYRVKGTTGEPFRLPLGNANVQRLYEARQFAVKCAEHFHWHCGGSDLDWPLIFTIHETAESPALWQFCVEREYEPSFYAKEATE